MFKRIKRTSLVLGIALTVILGMSYGTFIFTTNSYRSTEMLVGNLTYGIEITSTGGSETINGTSVSLTSGKTSTVLLKITSLNKIISKYGIDYKISSGTGSVKYASNTGWLPTGKINENNVGTYEKVIKVVISATTDVTVDFTVTGGYSNNDLTEVKDGYTRLTEIYDGIVDYKEDLKTIISKETTNNIYGGEAINNYLQYPTNTDTTKNIWRVLGYYNSVDGIKIVSNQTSTTTQSNITSSLTSFYNTLEKQEDYVLETNKFNCTNTTCTTSSYSNIGLLSTSEYNMLGGANSYLASNESYFALDSTTVKNITSSGITDTTTSTTSGLRPTIYLQSDVKVTGSGTISDPYRLSDKGDVIFASATLNGTALETFPKESDPYIPKTVTCTNGSVGQWNTEKQKIELTTVNLPTSCVVDFTEGYTVTLSATNGTVTAPTSKVIGRTGTATFTVTPNDGYKAELETNSCGGTLSGNIYTISNIIDNKTCSIGFKSSSSTLYAKLLADNPTRNTRDTYNAVFTTDTTGILYTATEKNVHNTTDTTVYYYAGNTTNNWMKFAGFYWRIIRTNADGSIKLLYSGTSHDTTSGYLSTGTSGFNSSYDSPKYVGYMYGSDDSSLPNARTNTTNSTIKTAIDNWYASNMTSYTKYLSTTAVYCNERNLRTGDTYSTSSTFYYAPYARVWSTYNPTYDCTEASDAFSGSNTSAKLTYPIALMTSDEIMRAGGKGGTSLTSPYAWYYLNSANGSITGDTYWWLMSPSYWNDSCAYVFLVRGSIVPGDLNWNIAYSSVGVRPVVSLKSCVKYSSGDGSPENPYEIAETTSGC